MSKFISRRGEFRLIIRPSDHYIDEARRPVVVPGERVEFHNHVFVTKDQSLIDYLKKHPLFKREFDIAEGDSGRPERRSNILEGARSAADSFAPPEGKVPIAQDRDLKAEAGLESPITRDEIAIMIDQKLDGFFSQMQSLIQGQKELRKEPETVNQVIKPEILGRAKRTFSCSQCGETGFKSGFDVAVHKREKHST